jgi:CRISPR-associated protein Cas1
MRLTDLHLLPRFADGLTFLYVERARVEQSQHAIVLIDSDDRVPVPVASLSVLMLGPGTVITHAAALACADNGCSVTFCGESGVRHYACGIGETHRAANLMSQARAWADPSAHIEVVRRLYRMRFVDPLDEALTLDQIRGMEGVRVRETYARVSRETGVRWCGRAYSGEWSSADAVNRALSTANACLYGLCHAAIVSTGFSPGLGFVHTGKALAFVYDVADLYKADVTIPVAFAAATGPLDGLESRTRRACRNAFRTTKLIERVVPDVQRALGLRPDVVRYLDTSDDEYGDEPSPSLWAPDGPVPGARNYAALDPDRAHVLHIDEDA